MTNKKISLSDMAEAVTRSGYLLEQRVFPTIEKAGFYVETNPVYPDPITQKSREYDFSALSALKVFREDADFLWIHLIGECINNSQPVVFFSSEKITKFLFHEDIKCSGIPLKLSDRNSDGDDISFQEFFHLDKFHHYCQGTYSTQYCSFRQKKSKSEWQAWHDEDHHGLFNTLVEATDYEMDEFFSSWDIPSKNEEEPFSIHIYYPLLIVRSDLYECKQKRGKSTFTQKKHIQFRKPALSGQTLRTVHIDVIVESYLDKYLELLESEHDKIVTRLKRKKKDVRASIEKIVKEAKNAQFKKKLKNFREILEF